MSDRSSPSTAREFVCSACRVQDGRCPDCGTVWHRDDNGKLLGVSFPAAHTREEWDAVMAANRQPTQDTCPTCEGDGYLESWNDDQSDVVITLCADCGGKPWRS